MAAMAARLKAQWLTVLLPRNQKLEERPIHDKKGDKNKTTEAHWQEEALTYSLAEAEMVQEEEEPRNASISSTVGMERRELLDSRNTLDEVPTPLPVEAEELRRKIKQLEGRKNKESVEANSGKTSENLPKHHFFTFFSIPF